MLVFFYSFYVVMWTTKIVFFLSLSLLLLCLQKWSFVLGRSFALRNSLMSLVSLSSQLIFLVRKKRENLYLYTRRKKRDKNRIESNTLNSINLFFLFSRFIKKESSSSFYHWFLFCSLNDKHIFIDNVGRFDMSSSWRRKNDNVPQNKWSSIVVDVFLSRSTTTYTQLRKYVVRRWASRPLNSITNLMSNGEDRVEIREPIRTIEIETVATNSKTSIDEDNRYIILYINKQKKKLIYVNSSRYFETKYYSHFQIL
jgi:hypothetical protein